MTWLRRVYMALAVSAALAVFTAPASAQSEVTYALAGVEIAATPTQGTFVGVATSPDDFGTWQATVVHAPLGDNTPITGGNFTLDGQVRNLQGIILGGEVVRLTGSCRKETFDVTGDVILFQDGIPILGDFEVTLTHYGRRVGGRCITFFATVEGMLRLSPTTP